MPDTTAKADSLADLLKREQLRLRTGEGSGETPAADANDVEDAVIVADEDGAAETEAPAAKPAAAPMTPPRPPRAETPAPAAAAPPRASGSRSRRHRHRDSAARPDLRHQ